ncbi:MAG: 3-phosphoshikimate 1-carboxyvinyltransferase [Planctomycetaceae bacterium]|nr:3-phosphoshikimate 1-carboxyvinyltransferase [Planctomycetaceae bacterium]
MSHFIEISPAKRPVCGTIRPPGSKSITNRALVLAALADGTSTLNGVLDSTDTRVMLESLRRLSVKCDHDPVSRACMVDGCSGMLPENSESVESDGCVELWLENSGTSIRFLTAACTLGQRRYRLDGVARMRQRPILDLVDALRQLGANVSCEQPPGDCPPVIVDGTAGRLLGGRVSIRGDISSQFLSGLLMAAPCAEGPVLIEVEGDLVSKPYVLMTLQMMAAFGVDVEYPKDLSSFAVPQQRYTARRYNIEPDASAASYFFGAAAVTGGTVTVEGLSQSALQGDIYFVTALQQMGCEVEWREDSVTVRGRTLHGVDIDMNAISDTAQTLAAVAVFADSPTTIRRVEHMRHKETDRIAAVVTELRRAGIRADEFADGLTVYPGTPLPAEIHTYDDHRMAMSIALLGLKSPGIRILDPSCTQKTYPEFFSDLQSLCEASA